LNTARSVLHKALEALVAAEGRLRAQQQAGKVSEIRLAEKQAEADSLAIVRGLRSACALLADCPRVVAPR